MTHDQLQAKCWSEAWNYANTKAPQVKRRFFSILNSAIESLGRNKAMQYVALGLLAGVWDFVFYDDVGGAHWIEFKVDGDYVSSDQKKFRNALLPIGTHFFYEVRDYETFWRIFMALVDRNIEILKSLEYK